LIARRFSIFRIWLLSLLAALSLTGCLTVADIIAPSTTEVGTTVLFKSQIRQGLEADPAQFSYQWNFGDGATASGPQVSHAYEQPGEYTVVLTMTDAEGSTYTSQAIVEVLPFTGTLVPVSVRVYDATGYQMPSNWPGMQGQSLSGPVGLSGVTVKVAGQSLSTDDTGRVLFQISQPVQAPVAIISKPGYLTQSVTVPAGNTQERAVVVLLKKESPAVSIPDIAQPQTVVSGEQNLDTLAAKVVIPEQAFVDAAGQPVTGAATARVTPWNITNATDMVAFPGQRRADGGSAGVVQLISFGMLSIEFEQNGQKLQLAPGKTAEISMDLPINQEIDGRAIVVGDTIPLWHFNESRGLWEQEGTGVVVPSDTSYTGLAVKATVSHFSSWNWDKVQDPVATAVSRELRCVVPVTAGGVSPLAADDKCLVEITQQLANGTLLSDTLVVPAGGSVFTNFVSTAVVKFQAEALMAGNRGTATWTVNADEATSVLDILLDQQLFSTVVPGDVPVVTELGPVVTFSLPYALYSGINFEVREADLAVWIKGADGTLTPLPFKPFFGSEYIYDPAAWTYSYRLLGAGNAAGASMLGALSGSLAVTLPVDRDITWEQGQKVVGYTETLQIDVTVPVQTYSGPTLVQAPSENSNDLTFALWDEVGVSSPIQDNSQVEMSFMVISGGWTSDYTPWLPTQAPSWLIRDGSGYSQQANPTYFKPYFQLGMDCNQMNDYLYGTYKVLMRVRVTDPVTGERKVYTSKPFVHQFSGPACT
jgi:PKD repeat protein